MNKIITLVVLMSLAISSSSEAGLRASQQYQDIVAGEPNFTQVVTEAFRHERLQWQDLARLQKKLQKSHWLPQLAIGYDHALRESTAVSVSDNISVTTQGVVVGPDDNDFDESLNTGKTIRVRAVWELDKTVFNPSSFQLVRAKQELMRSRFNLSQYLFKIYSERRKALRAYHFSRQAKLRSDLYERIDLLTQQLNFYTNGVFSQQWWRKP